MVRYRSGEALNHLSFIAVAGKLCGADKAALSITVHLDLPDALAKEAKASGLLESSTMTELISTELRRRKAATELSGVLDQIRSEPGEEMSMDDIQAEVEGVRSKKAGA